MNKYNRIFLAASAVVGLLFLYVPEIDLWAAALFYDPYRGFDLVPHTNVPVFVRATTKMFVFASCILLILNTVRLNLFAATKPILASPRIIIFLLFTLGLGPGLLVNNILKNHWGRARPNQIRQFGGARRFTAAFVLSDQCKSNCSFVSGDASIGYYGLAFYFVARRRRRMIASSALLSGTTIGLIRMAQGAHFLSDIVFSGVFTVLVAWLLSVLILDRQNAENLLHDRVRTEISRSRISPSFLKHSILHFLQTVRAFFVSSGIFAERQEERFFMSRPKHFRYSLNQNIRRTAKWIMRSVTNRSNEQRLDLHKEKIEKILLVRATFRMGDSVLAAPAISVFRKQFPDARIDFVGAPISETLFRNLPIDHHFCITRRFPHSSWAYLVLVKKLRSLSYDLAVDLSCSQSAMGSFIVGFSGARFRVGLQGQWDRWFNVRIPRPPERNKYQVLPALLRSLGLETEEIIPSLVFSPAEKEEGRKNIKDLIRWDRAPTVGVFVGGRKTWAKRWPTENFCQLITALHWQGVNVVTFFGPEEKSLIGFFRDALEPAIPLVFEPSLRNFAAMVSNCDLFVTCDSGPMHLACALGTRTIAIFQNPNFDHWGPPPTLGRIVYQPGGCSAEEVLDVCLAELAYNLASVSDSCGKALSSSLRAGSVSHSAKATRRLELSLCTQRLVFFDRWAEALFFLALSIYTWFFPPSGIFEDGTWTDAFTDALGIGSLLTGGVLRIWAVSHIGEWTGPRRLNAPTLITRGPYACVRHPLYIGHFLMGLGAIFLLEAFPLLPFLFAWAAWQHLMVISAEERFLEEKLGEGFALYCYLVPKYIPRVIPDLQNFSLGTNFPLNELATVWAVIIGASFFEWIEYPLHRDWIVSSFHWLVK